VDDSVADASVRPDAANGDAAIADAESDATSDAESDAATPAPVPPEPTDAGPPKPARFVWSCR
jgi:hypothetical protein